MNKQYTWSTEELADPWNNSVESSINGCISEAKACGAHIDSTIYVGECESFRISVNSSDIFERLCDEAYDFAGESAEDWIDDSKFTKEDVEKLDKKLTQVITDFLMEHSLEPCFYQVSTVKAVIIVDERIENYD